jgi:uncharacterized protein YkwD
VRLALSVVVAALALVPAGHAADRQTTLEAGMTRVINAIRREHGLRPLTISAGLTAAAVQHTREMGTDGYFAHRSRNGSEFWKRIEHWYGSTGWRSWEVGENLLYSAPYTSATDAVTSWMNSPPHRENILDPSWHELGIAAIHFDDAPGEYRNGPVTIVTADFGDRR